MSFPGHAFGHRKGRGNRWDHEIDDIILNYMAEEQLNYGTYVYDQMWRYLTRSSLKFHTQTHLAEVIRKQKAPIVVSWDTVIRHLNIHVEEHILGRRDERGDNNEIYYYLPEIRIKTKGLVMAKNLILNDGTIVTNIIDKVHTQIPNYCFRIPNYYFHYFHLFPGFRIDFPKSHTAFL